ncbi:hypothetical protein SVIOM74S_00667 [Streptomyces violarus]
MRKRTLLLATALTTGLLTALPATAATAAPATGPKADFNGDGYGDVAFAAPYAKVDGKGMAGYVAVVYGGATGLDPAKRTVVSQNTAGVPGAAEAEDTFGDALAVADLNGDGYTDLAVGSSGEDVGTDTDGGSVTVLWGSASGLKNGTSVKDPAVSGHDHWGRLLTAGDFDGDGKKDLAVGTGSSHAYVSPAARRPTTTSATPSRPPTPTATATRTSRSACRTRTSRAWRTRAGSTSFRGGSGGLSGARSSWIAQTVLGPADSHASFGYTVRLRDLTADGKADLAVGAAGGALLMRGTATVPTKTGAVVLPELGGSLPD